MEPLLLKDYFEILRNHYKIFIVFIILSSLIAASLTYIIPKSYTSSINVYVRHPETNISNSFYTYDGYYSTQASVEYTNTVVGFLESLPTVNNAALLVQDDPSYKNNGYRPVDLASNPDYLVSFQKNITVRMVAPQLINVSVKDSNPEVSRLWAQALGTVVTSNLKQLNQEANTNFNIDTIHVPITQTNQLNLWLDTLIGFIVGIFLGFMAGFIIEAYKK